MWSSSMASFDGYIASPKGDNVTANDDGDLIYATTGNSTITGGGRSRLDRGRLG